MITGIQQNQNLPSFKSYLHIGGSFYSLYGERGKHLIEGANQAAKVLRNDYCDDDIFLFESLYKKGYPTIPRLIYIQKKPITFFGKTLFSLPRTVGSKFLPRLFPYNVNAKTNPEEFVKTTLLETVDQLRKNS